LLIIYKQKKNGTSKEQTKMKKNWKTPKKKKHVTSSNLVPGELFPLNTSAIQTLIRVKSLSTFYSKKK
jgi:hypothetical protein